MLKKVEHLSLDERTARGEAARDRVPPAGTSAKALSPGVNDPTTSTRAPDQIELLLWKIGVRRLTPGVGRDSAGMVRFRYAAPTWEDYLSLAVDAPQ